MNHEKDNPERIDPMRNSLRKAKIEISLRSLLQILEKLYKEGYVAYRTDMVRSPTGAKEAKFYYITYDGIQLLGKHRNYSGYLEWQTEKESKKELKEIAINIGLVLFGVMLASFNDIISWIAELCK